MQYNRQMLLKEKSQWQYALYMALWKFRSGLNALFPSVNKLRKKYPCAKNILLLPFVWIYHVLSFPVKNRRKIAPGRDIQWGTQSGNAVVQKRMELFAELGMLD